MDAKDNKESLSDLSKRFLSAIEMTGYTDYHSENETDVVSQATITQIRAGRNEPSMPVVTAFLKKFPSVNGHWLLTGSGKPLLKIYSGNRRGYSSYEQLLHGIPVKEIVLYIDNHEFSRAFNKTDIYNLFLEVRTQRRLTQEMQALEARLEKVMKNHDEE